MSWGCTVQSDWLNSALSPVVYGDIASIHNNNKKKNKNNIGYL